MLDVREVWGLNPCDGAQSHIASLNPGLVELFSYRGKSVSLGARAENKKMHPHRWI